MIFLKVQDARINASMVTKDTDRAAVRVLRKTAFKVRRDAIDSIERREGETRRASLLRDDKGRFLKGSGRRSRVTGEASPPGTPVRTARGQVQRAIVYSIDSNRLDGVVGPRASFMGESMQAHEHGGERFGRKYPARPTMGPALDKNTNLFGGLFANSLGE